MAENKGTTGTDAKFMDKLFSADTLKETPAFNLGMAGLQVAGLLIFSFIGATASFGFKDWLSTITDYSYWVLFVIMTGEQFYAYNVAYQLALSLMLSSDKYKESIAQTTDLLEGVSMVDDKGVAKWIIKPLKEDSTIIDIAVDEMNFEERERLFKGRIQDAIDSALQFIDVLKEKRKIRWFFKKWRDSIRLRKIGKLEHQIELLNNKMTDKDYLARLDDRKIPGYKPIDSASLYSSQEDSDPNLKQSKYGKRNRKTFERMGAGKRALVRFATGIFLPLVAWGAVSMKGGAVFSMVVMIIMQFRSGWVGAMKIFKSVDMYNASQDFKTVKEIQRRVPLIKDRLAEEKRLADQMAALELAKKKAFVEALGINAAKMITQGKEESEAYKHEVNTFDILPKLNISKSAS